MASNCILLRTGRQHRSASTLPVPPMTEQDVCCPGSRTRKPIFTAYPNYVLQINLITKPILWSPSAWIQVLNLCKTVKERKQAIAWWSEAAPEMPSQAMYSPARHKPSPRIPDSDKVTLRPRWKKQNQSTSSFCPITDKNRINVSPTKYLTSFLGQNDWWLLLYWLPVYSGLPIDKIYWDT